MEINDGYYIMSEKRPKEAEANTCALAVELLKIRSSLLYFFFFNNPFVLQRDSFSHQSVLMPVTIMEATDTEADLLSSLKQVLMSTVVLELRWLTGAVFFKGASQLSQR